MTEHKNLHAALLDAQRRADRWAEADAIRAIARVERQPCRRRGRSTLERFFSLVGFGMSDCWYWTGSVTKLGYGCCAESVGEVRAHRLAYRLFHGSIPPGLEVMHSCDVRSCVNPAHLSVGTHADNVRDCVRRGRWRGGEINGELNPMARLTRSQVAEIRQRKLSGEPQVVLASAFGVSPMTISRIVRGETWR